MLCGLRLRTGVVCSPGSMREFGPVGRMLLVGGDDLSGRDEVGIDEDVEMCALVHFAGGLDHEAGGRHHYVKW